MIYMFLQFFPSTWFQQWPAFAHPFSRTFCCCCYCCRCCRCYLRSTLYFIYFQMGCKMVRFDFYFSVCDWVCVCARAQSTTLSFVLRLKCLTWLASNGKIQQRPHSRIIERQPLLLFRFVSFFIVAKAPSATIVFHAWWSNFHLTKFRVRRRTRRSKLKRSIFISFSSYFTSVNSIAVPIDRFCSTQQATGQRFSIIGRHKTKWFPFVLSFQCERESFANVFESQFTFYHFRFSMRRHGTKWLNATGSGTNLLNGNRLRISSRFNRIIVYFFPIFPLICFVCDILVRIEVL